MKKKIDANFTENALMLFFNSFFFKNIYKFVYTSKNIYKHMNMNTEAP